MLTCILIDSCARKIRVLFCINTLDLLYSCIMYVTEDIPISLYIYLLGYNQIFYPLGYNTVRVIKYLSIKYLCYILTFTSRYYYNLHSKIRVL